MKKLTSARTSGLLTGKMRKVAVYGMLGLGLLGPAQAFGACFTTVTRYLLLGYEVWRTEEVTCTHNNN